MVRKSAALRRREEETLGSPVESRTEIDNESILSLEEEAISRGVRDPTAENNEIEEGSEDLTCGQDSAANSTLGDDLPFTEGDHWTHPVGVKPPKEKPLDNEWNKKAHLLVSMHPQMEQEFIEGYQEDPFFKKQYVDETPSPKTVVTPHNSEKGIRA
ncbi:hypothetical protein DXG01_007747 [Tephrocybe rancida]|nr:hypothetical protein DXG01_007747 [Tephrocybe rancida]